MQGLNCLVPRKVRASARFTRESPASDDYTIVGMKNLLCKWKRDWRNSDMVFLYEQFSLLTKKSDFFSNYIKA